VAAHPHTHTHTQPPSHPATQPPSHPATQPPSYPGGRYRSNEVVLIDCVGCHLGSLRLTTLLRSMPTMLSTLSRLFSPVCNCIARESTSDEIGRAATV
jgi:hypothetical protein